MVVIKNILFCLITAYSALYYFHLFEMKWLFTVLIGAAILVYIVDLIVNIVQKQFRILLLNLSVISLLAGFYFVVGNIKNEIIFLIIGDLLGVLYYLFELKKNKKVSTSLLLILFSSLVLVLHLFIEIGYLSASIISLGLFVFVIILMLIKNLKKSEVLDQFKNTAAIVGALMTILLIALNTGIVPTPKNQLRFPNVIDVQNLDHDKHKEYMKLHEEQSELMKDI